MPTPLDIALLTATAPTRYRIQVPLDLPLTCATAPNRDRPLAIEGRRMAALRRPERWEAWWTPYAIGGSQHARRQIRNPLRHCGKRREDRSICKNKID